MGMYDSIIFTCHKCNNKIIAQSKGGKCDLKKYHYTSVPGDSAADILNDEITCNHCNTKYIITGNIPRTNLTLRPVKDFSYD